MFNDIKWREKENEEKCKSNAREVADYARRFLRGHAHSWDQDQKRNGTKSDKPDGIGDEPAEK